MEPYANNSGHSGVAGYLTGADSIIVEFQPTKYSNITFYKYTYASAGSAIIEQMKILAQQGLGLHTFINKVVKQNYAAKGSSLASVQ